MGTGFYHDTATWRFTSRIITTSNRTYLLRGIKRGCGRGGG